MSSPPQVRESSLPAALERSRSTIAANLALGLRRYRRSSAQRLFCPRRAVELTALAAVAIVIACLALDAPVGSFRGHFDPALTHIAESLTDIGKSGWYLFPSGIALIVLTFRQVGALSKTGRLRLFRWNLILSFIFVGVGLPSLIATILKRFIGRPRPVHFFEDGLFGLHPFSDASYASFPSGHSTTIGALAMVLSLLMPRYRVAFAALALFIGATRVIVGAHYPSDVLAGLLLGSVGAWLIAKLAARSSLLFIDNAKGWPELRPAHRLARLLE